jgi:hypothetical protein
LIEPVRSTFRIILQASSKKYLNNHVEDLMKAGEEEPCRSEVARLRKQIETEYEAALRGLHGLAAGYSRHDFIEARLRNLETYHLALSRLIGDDPATALVINSLEQVEQRLNPDKAPEEEAVPAAEATAASEQPAPRPAPRPLSEIREAHRIDLEGLALASGCTPQDIVYLEQGGRVLRRDAEKVIAALSRLSGENLQLEDVTGLQIVEEPPWR